MEFADVARELLLVAPQDFVAERTARQRAVRKDDRALATAIGRLRKPAPAAWVIDLLAHDGALDDAVDLGPALRRAQADADPDAIRTLRRQRTEVVDALAQAGADLASDAGHPVTPAVLEQVRATIEAAMADPHAGAAVRSGLLVTALESVGFDAVDLDGALADPDAVPDAWSGSDAPPIPISQARGARQASRASRAAQRDAPEPDAEPEPEPEPEPASDPAADRKAARQAETAARTESRDADAALDTAEADLEQAEERRAELQRALEQAEADITRLEAARDEAEAASDRARDVLHAAQEHRRKVGR
ncbi:hypothetical protein N8D74_10630 [Curtobacterium flaccumfaciens]|uniref:Uncharacterized protein n=1 Tax=Curtobacterium poinsettiae TaxID=159612 RepID=A0A9Q9PBL8_9MICO|nr:hypothetical protein [Curtobacterium flaccumfaciens]UXN24036.1 hypothetical protein N8D74_10630 [Curtobacterium flaccumfaciens]UYC82150.1 hypothetical protein OE229_06715 [Curtobacterium flaccumfaciens pv. poinsettiae]